MDFFSFNYVDAIFGSSNPVHKGSVALVHLSNMRFVGIIPMTADDVLRSRRTAMNGPPLSISRLFLFNRTCCFVTRLITVRSDHVVPKGPRLWESLWFFCTTAGYHRKSPESGPQAAQGELESCSSPLTTFPSDFEEVDVAIIGFQVIFILVVNYTQCQCLEELIRYWSRPH